MSFFTIDENKCAADGLCVAECPMGILTMDHKTPAPVEHAEELCINCGHCVAVCPHGAFSLNTMAAEACAPMEPELLPTPEVFRRLVRSRRSTRVYKNKPIEQEKLARLLDTARYAPTAKNTQQLGWLVISRKELLEELAGKAVDWMRDLIAKKDPLATTYHMPRLVARWEEGRDPVLRSAPCLVMTHAPDDYRTGMIDSTIALTTFELAAATEGVGTCWAGFLFSAATFWPPLREALGLPAGRVITGAMMAGYPKNAYERIPLRNEAQVIWR